MPRCVESCPTGALVFGDLDDPNSDIAQLAAKLDTESLSPEFATDSLVQYVNIPKRFVAGEVVCGDNEGECASGVSVTLNGSAGERKTVTDLFGDFEFEGLDKNEEYTISITADGYAAKELSFITQRDVNLGEIVLDPK